MKDGVSSEALRETTPEVVERLVAGHRGFLAFLEGRLRDRAAAEDILQAAYARAIEKGDQVRDADSVVPWFYRLLRNSLTDHYRRREVEGRALERVRTGSDDALDPELRDTVCACFRELLPTLKPEYAEVVRRVDLDETPIRDIAREMGITVNNATVRLHRARRALRRSLERSCGTCATHGCLDCSCGGATARGHGGGCSG